MHRIILIVTAALALPHAARAEPWSGPPDLDALYTRIADDLGAGRPLIIAGFYGMWFEHSDEPARNLNWGTYYGHARMLARASRDRAIRKLYRHTDWRLVSASTGSYASTQRDVGPIETLVYHQRVRANARWRRRGVTEPFDVFLVMMAFESREGAGVSMTRALRDSHGGIVQLDDGRRIHLDDAQLTGYVGLNFFYD